MKPSYLSDLKPNQVFTATFLVHGKDVRQKKSGEPYLSLLLGDRTGEIDAKMWDNVAEVVDTFDRDDFVTVAEEAVDEVRADEARTAGDDDPHAVRPTPS